MSDLDRTVGTTDVARSARASDAATTDATHQVPRDDTQQQDNVDVERGDTKDSPPADGAGAGAQDTGADDTGAPDTGADHTGAQEPSANDTDAADAGSAEVGSTEADVALTGTVSDGTTSSPSEVWRLSAVAAVHMELPSANPEIVIHESQHPWRELRIPVGMAEGTAIAYAFRGIPTPRPLTHELFTEILERHGVSVEAVRITVRRGQLFHAELDTMGPRGRQVVPCRPSDAIALHLRQRMPTPLLVAEWVFTDAGAEDSGTR